MLFCDLASSYGYIASSLLKVLLSKQHLTTYI